MKKLGCFRKSSLLLLSICLHSAMTQASDNRATIWGMTGSQTFGQLDALIPLNRGCNSLFYGDLQGRFNHDDEGFVGLGLGYRSIQGNGIWGGNLFVDHGRTEHHHGYWVVSPGLETIHTCWDARINGYIPFDRRHDEGSFFPSGINTCGEHGDCSFVEFKGHQQFEHRFLAYEEVGAGLDVQAGVNLPFRNSNFHAGAYYYHLSESDDVRGVAARFEIPVTQNWAISSVASYDNNEHGAVAVGLRFQVGQPLCSQTLCDRLADPIYRYLPVKSGGLPAHHGNKDEGLFLRQDDIWFFSETGTAELGDANAGTFENPFADDQFAGATVTAIGPDANLYFNTGTFLIGLDPNFLIPFVELEQGQSIYGRTSDFKCTANGDERPIILGRLSFVNSTNHIIDSIILENSEVIIPGLNQSGISISNAELFVCNSSIRVSKTVQGDLPINRNNLANGIVSQNNNILVLHNSEVVVNAVVTGNSQGFNAAHAIGITGAAIQNNQFTIENSSLVAVATVGGDLSGGPAVRNEAIGIGSDRDFSDNTVSMFNSEIITEASVAGTGSGFARNLSIGIGDETTTMLRNTFNILDSRIDSEASIGATAGTSENIAVGVGAAFQPLSFSNNTVNITASDVDARALVKGSNNGFRNTAVGVGTYGTGTVATFNTFNISLSRITSEASVALNNGALSANNSVGVRNLFGNFSDNIVNLNHTLITSNATINGNNLGINGARGVGVGSQDSILTVGGCTVEVNALITGDNSGFNDSYGINSGVDTDNTVSSSLFDVLSKVSGHNSNWNTATGAFIDVGGNLDILNSRVNVSAFADAETNQAFATDGLGTVSSPGTVFNVVENP